MRVALLGWAQGCACGVSDYTAKLGDALRKLGVETWLPDARDVSARSGTRLLAALRSWRPHVLHLQYPAMAYRLSVAPVAVLVAGSWKRALTVHEFSECHLLRKIMTLMLLAASDAAIFTSAAELRACGWWSRSIAGKAGVIPIGSNVESRQPSSEKEQQGGERAAKSASRDDEVVIAYFGLIRAKKGLEDFVELAKRAKKEGYRWRFVIIGETPKRYQAYERRIRTESEETGNVEWAGPLPERDVVEALRSATAVYLPYPDGVSERRSSLLGVLAAGVPVITTEGRATTAELREVTLVIRSVEEAIGAVRDVVGNRELRERLGQKAREYLEQRSWDRIAWMHVELYERMLGGPKQSRGAGLGVVETLDPGYRA